MLGEVIAIVAEHVTHDAAATHEPHCLVSNHRLHNMRTQPVMQLQQLEPSCMVS